MGKLTREQIVELRRKIVESEPIFREQLKNWRNHLVQTRLLATGFRISPATVVYHAWKVLVKGDSGESIRISKNWEKDGVCKLCEINVLTRWHTLGRKTEFCWPCRDRLSHMLNGYRRYDRQKEFANEGLNRLVLVKLIKRGCLYCGETNFRLIGLDRVNNLAGHVLQNVVPCCKRCNFIKSDMPAEVWESVLSRGVKATREAGLFDLWQSKRLQVGAWGAHTKSRKRVKAPPAGANAPGGTKDPSGAPGP